MGKLNNVEFCSGMQGPPRLRAVQGHEEGFWGGQAFHHAWLHHMQFAGSIFFRPCMCKEPFTYIDKVLVDRRDFYNFVQRKEDEKKSAFMNVARMKSHPWFPEFCEAMGVPPESWGRLDGEPVEEYQLFADWLLHAEQDGLFLYCMHIPCMQFYKRVCRRFRRNHAGSKMSWRPRKPVEKTGHRMQKLRQYTDTRDMQLHAHTLLLS